MLRYAERYLKQIRLEDYVYSHYSYSKRYLGQILEIPSRIFKGFHLNEKEIKEFIDNKLKTEYWYLFLKELNDEHRLGKN